MTGWSNGNSFGASVGNAAGAAPAGPVGDGTCRWPVAPWQFGLRLSDDRGDI